ncbi:Rz1-like lysis system protein LysC [Serratia ureilytica]|uniref:Rz1-like lysis system protein LysC n=1 Tax=Serratia ureilytica TaxID=300181 RepID=UPI003F7D10FE
MSAPVALLLVLCLTSCTSPTVLPPAPIILLPPESVFKPCEQPALHGETWGDIGSYTLQLQTALSIFASQVATLSQWRKSIL